MSNHLYMPSIFFMRVICEDMKEIDIFFYESNVRRYEKDRFLGYHNLNQLIKICSLGKISHIPSILKQKGE